MSFNMSDLVSVIIPTYNRSGFLKVAIQSVIAQSYPHIEIIIVDDGSTDDTAKVMGQYQYQHQCSHLPKNSYPIRCVYQPNKGVAFARNAGLEAARGKYIAYLDDDDLFLPQKISWQINKFHKNSNLGLVATGAYIVDENDTNLEVQIPPKTSLEAQTWSLLYHCSYINSTVIVKAECHQKVGVFRNRDLEDYDMWLRISRYFPIGVIQKPLVKYRRHSSQFTNPENLQRLVNATQQIALDFLYELPIKESFPKVNSKPQEHLIKGAFLCRYGLFNKAKEELHKAKSDVMYIINAQLWLGLIELYNQNYSQAEKEFDWVLNSKPKADPSLRKFAYNGLALIATMRQTLAANRDTNPKAPHIEDLRKSISRLQIEMMNQLFKI